MTYYKPDWSGPSPTSYLASPNTTLYAGMVLDPTTGLYYDEARWYSTAVSTFISRDPSGLAAGDANLYRYCGNAPTDGIDPSGETSIMPAKEIDIKGWVDTGIRVGTGKVFGQDWLPDGHQFIHLSDGSNVGFYPVRDSGLKSILITSGKSLIWTPGIVGPDGDPGDKADPGTG